jgi:hypothetical protein
MAEGGVWVAVGAAIGVLGSVGMYRPGTPATPGKFNTSNPPLQQ